MDTKDLKQKLHNAVDALPEKSLLHLSVIIENFGNESFSDEELQQHIKQIFKEDAEVFKRLSE